MEDESYDPYGKEELRWVPPMMGFEDELVCVYAGKKFGELENGGLSTHYTAIVNGKRVFVFAHGEDRWLVLLAPPHVWVHDELRAYSPMHKDIVYTGDPFGLKMFLVGLTSGGNNEAN